MLLANDGGDKPNFGEVVAVGEGKKNEDGSQTKPNLSVGATVMYSKYSGTEFEVRAVWLGLLALIMPLASVGQRSNCYSTHVQGFSAGIR